jgi:hypothetical protein
MQAKPGVEAVTLGNALCTASMEERAAAVEHRRRFEPA